MAAIQFEQPIEGELTTSGRSVLVLGVFESGKTAFIREDGELWVTDDPVRLFVSGWPIEDSKAVDTDDKGESE